MSSSLIHHAKKFCQVGVRTLGASAPSSSSVTTTRNMPILKRALLDLRTERMKLEQKHLVSEREHFKAIEALLEREAECEQQLALLSASGTNQPEGSVQEVAAAAVTPGNGISAESTKKAVSSGKKSLVLNFDGASKNNPGDAGAGWVLTDANTGSSLAFGWKYLGSRNTNNEAEYTGLIEGLAYISAHVKDAERIDVKGDSNLVVQQVLGNWKCRSENLVPYYSKARTLYKSLKKQNSELNLMYVPREENPVADGLSNLAVKLRTARIFEDVNMHVDVEYLKSRFC